MSVSADGAAHIMSVLTNLYSNPNLAVLREYSANALDSHKAANSTEPIEISLPSAFRPQFKVTDHGVGMSADDIRNIYSVFGASTKRDDFKQVGAFGLGCKAALTLTQTFNLIAIKDGRRTVVDISRGEDGVGVVSILSETDTTERNGVTVTVPIPDYRRFNENVEEFFLTWETGTVLVDGNAPKSMHDDSFFAHPDGLYKIKATERYTESAFFVIMGGVAYKVNNYEVSLGYELNNAIVYIDIPIGAIDLTPSREGIRYSDRSKTYLRKLVRMVLDSLSVTMSTALAEQKTKSDVIAFISKHYSLFRDDLQRQRISWNGELVPSRISFLDSALRLSNYGHYTYDQAGNKQYKTTLQSASNSRFEVSIIDAANTLTQSDKYIFCKVDSLSDITSYKKSLIKYYLMSVEQTADRTHTYLYLHEEEFKSSMWLKDFGTFVKFDDILEAGKEYRKAHPAAPRPAATTPGEKITYESVILTYDPKTKEPSFERKALTADELKSHNTYRFNSDMRILDGLRTLSLTGSGTEDDRNGLVTALNILGMEKDTTFVYLRKSRKPEALESRIGRPVEDFGKVLYEAHQKMLKDIPQEDQIAVDVYNEYRYKTGLKKMFQHFIDSNVLDSELLEICKNFVKWFDIGEKYARLGKVGIRIPLTNQGRIATKGLATLDKRYPGLQIDSGYMMTSPFIHHMDHAVIYVNAVYETTKKD